MDEITIPKQEYDELRSRPSRDELDREVKAKVEAAEKAVEAAEAAKAKVESEKAELETKLSAAEETARAGKLRDERVGALGPGFIAKLGEKTKARLTEQAASMSDEEWTARLEEVEEAYDVKRDAGAEDPDAGKGDEFSKEEIAAARAGRQSGGGGNGDPSPTARRSVVAGLIRK